MCAANVWDQLWSISAWSFIIGWREVTTDKTKIYLSSLWASKLPLMFISWRHDKSLVTSLLYMPERYNNGCCNVVLHAKDQLSSLLFLFYVVYLNNVCVCVIYCCYSNSCFLLSTWWSRPITSVLRKWITGELTWRLICGCVCDRLMNEMNEQQTTNNNGLMMDSQTR